MTRREKQYYKYFVLGGLVSEEDFRKMQEVKNSIPHEEFIQMYNEMRENHRQLVAVKKQLKNQK